MPMLRGISKVTVPFPRSYFHVFISLALVFYSIGVWSEHCPGRLEPWHLVFFWLGLVCDTVGTTLMFEMAGGLTWSVHGLTGVIAILLMVVHTMSATVVLVRPR